MKETMRLKCDAVPNMVNLNEMDYDLENEWDGNEWVGLWYMKWIDKLWHMRWMRWKWLGKYVTPLSLSIWKMKNSFTNSFKISLFFFVFFWVLQLSEVLIVCETQRLLKSYQITFLQYITLSNKSSHISLAYCFGLLSILPEVNN